MYRKIKARATIAVVTAITGITALSAPGAASASSGFAQQLATCMSLSAAISEFNNQTLALDAAGQTKAADAAHAQANALQTVAVAEGCGAR
jgi:hypothetical protein